MTANKILIFPIMAITLFYALGEKTDRDKKLCIQIVTVILTCFSGFRSWQMGDVYHYGYLFQQCNEPGWQLDFESRDNIGLQILFFVVGKLGGDMQMCLLIIAAFVAITLGVLIYKYSPSPYWSYVIYLAMGFYISSFNILKQIVAMGFIVLAMIQVMEHKPLRFLIFVVIAGLFHQPALIFVIAYPFANKKIDSTYFLITGVIATIAFVFRAQIVEQLVELYYNEEQSFQIMESVGGKVAFMILIILLALFMRPIKNYDTHYRQLFSLMVLAAIIQTLAVYDNVFTRLSDYFFQFSVLFIPFMLQSGEEQAVEYPGHKGEIRYFTSRSYLLVQLCITIFAIGYYFYYINENAALLQEFHFFWN